MAASIPSLIFGAVGGWIIGELTRPISSLENKAILAGCFIICMLLAVLTIYIINHARREEEGRQLLFQAIGTPAELIFERADTNKGEYYRRLINFIELASAGDEILIISQHKLNENINDQGESKERREARELYSRILLQKAMEPGITYHRIICFEEGPTKGEIKAGRLKPWLVEHCEKMLEIRKAKPQQISLKKARATINADTWVISRKVGTIVVDIIDSQTGLVFTNGALIFHNPPNGRIIEQLRDWFMELEGDDETVNVTSLIRTTA